MPTLEHDHAENVSTTTCPACLHEGNLRQQRAERGFSDEDAWSFDVYVAGVLAGGIKHLRDNLHGCPPKLVPDGDVDVGCKRWVEILDEMATGFQSYHDADSVEVTPEVIRSLELLREWWGALWD